MRKVDSRGGEDRKGGEEGWRREEETKRRGEMSRGATGEFHFTPFYRLFRKNVAKMPSFTDFWT